MLIKILLIPLISALIGYVTNVVAIRLLFWPRKPINLGLYELQGLLPKRQAEIAVSVGDLVEEQLLSLDEIFEKINTPETMEMAIVKTVKVLREKLDNMLPRFLPAMVVQLVGDIMEKVVRQEAPGLINQLIESGHEYLSKDIQIRKIVTQKIIDFDLDQLEDMIRSVSNKELTFIEILGGVLGFIIGLVQVGIIFLFP
ncbi:MAG: DUF445 family protein [Syntrophomonadaceae bacterium]|jgi:uncharacterized membrane protein YheB (UPF0754 family)|nr:DUF445 family protein [Syntrophomonadaceae bacterium]